MIKYSMGAVDVNNLVIYDVSITSKDDTALRQLYQRIDEGDVSLSRPSPMKTIDSIFPLLEPGYVYVVVEVLSK